MTVGRVGITAIGFDKGAMVDTYHLTPLGLEVREALAKAVQQ